MSEVTPMRGHLDKPMRWWCSCCMGDRSLTRAIEKRMWRSDAEDDRRSAE